MAGINFGQVLGGLGLVSGILGQQRAQRDASRARRDMTAASNAAAEKERAAAAELLRLYNQRMGIVNQAREQGVYDATKMVERLDRDWQRNQARTLENVAGAFRVMGYRPGDSEPGTRMQAAMQQGLTQRNQQAEQLRQTAPLQLLNALGLAENGLVGRAASLEGAAANRLAGLNASLYNDANSRTGDINELLGAVMPYLNPKPKQQQVQTQAQPQSGGSMYGPYRLIGGNLYDKQKRLVGAPSWGMSAPGQNVDIA